MGGARIVQKFEDLIAWQMARELTRSVFKTTSRPVMRQHIRFCEQYEAAVLSIMNNIAEGFERNSRADFARFLVIAKGSCGEVRSMSYVALDAGLIEQSELQSLLDQTDQLARVIQGLRKTVDRQRVTERPKAPRSSRSRTNPKLEARSPELTHAQ